MKATVTLEGKDVRQIIASYLGIPLDDVIQLRYGYAVTSLTVEQIEEKMEGGES